MRKIKSYGTSIVALVLALVLGVNGVVNVASMQNKTADANIRTVQTKEICKSDLSEFETYSIKKDETSPSFSGIAKYTDDESKFFDNVSLDKGAENYWVQYDCSFDMEELQYTLIVTVLDEEKNVVEADTLISDAIVTENGGLDTFIKIGDESYLLSELCQESGLDSCASIILVDPRKVIARVVAALTVVTESAEQIKGKSNYKYNKKIEENGKGVSKGNYITDQSENKRKGFNAGNYRFGFTTFGKVGCEVAAAYNTMIKLGKAEKLSETIYCFEKWAIEFSVGWGHLGSDPLEIGRYLSKKGIGYSKYVKYSKFKSAVEGKKKCYVIMSRWNNPISKGLHTFFVEKKGNSHYSSYNFTYLSGTKRGWSIDDFNNGKGFIVGYVVWKK